MRRNSRAAGSPPSTSGRMPDATTTETILLILSSPSVAWNSDERTSKGAAGSADSAAACACDSNLAPPQSAAAGVAVAHECHRSFHHRLSHGLVLDFFQRA